MRSGVLLGSSAVCLARPLDLFSHGLLLRSYLSFTHSIKPTWPLQPTLTTSFCVSLTFLSATIPSTPFHTSCALQIRIQISWFHSFAIYFLHLSLLYIMRTWSYLRGKTFPGYPQSLSARWTGHPGGLWQNTADKITSIHARVFQLLQISETMDGFSKRAKSWLLLCTMKDDRFMPSEPRTACPSHQSLLSWQTP